MTFSKHRAFSDMSVSLRAGAAAGMNTTINLEPESAIHLAEILDMHRDALKESIKGALMDKESSK